MEKTHKLWPLFSNAFNIENLTGISLRYVNKFNLPLDTKHLTEYFTTYLKDDKNTHSIYGFQLKYNSFDRENNFNIYIGHALEKPIENSIPYLIDIDVIYNSNIENNAEIIWPIFEKIRTRKNLIFNNSLTDQAKSLIN